MIELIMITLIKYTQKVKDRRDAKNSDYLEKNKARKATSMSEELLERSSLRQEGVEES